MPQGRRKDFSGRKKKVQLQQKRQRKAGDEQQDQDQQHTYDISGGATDECSSSVVGEASKGGSLTHDLLTSVTLSARSGEAGRQKYELRFRKETKEELAKMREEARKAIKPLEPTSLESKTEDFFPENLGFPLRPPWTGAMSKRQLEENEEKEFRKFVAEICDERSVEMSHFELNLDTWRQLWRVLEMSDVLLVIVDARYPTAMFPTELYRYIRKAGKDLILVLNKVDLIPMALTLAWEAYFTEKFPGLQVVFFSSCPSYNLRGKMNDKGLKYRRLRGRIRMVSEGALNVWKACDKIIEENKAKVDLDSWKKLIITSKESSSSGEEEAIHVEEDQDAQSQMPAEHNRFSSNLLTLGMIGHPNAGKSSLINSLVGKRVVSVSKTPGHTKHFQTIFITKSVKLCDCPGLVFPSLVPKALQVMMGSYPISQVREPFSVVQYLAERVDLVKILNLLITLDSYSAFDICEAWAQKRGYVSARSNRLDINRSANHILRMALEGKITVNLYPVGFKFENWENHPSIKQIEQLLAIDEDGERITSGSSGEESDDQSENDPEEENVEEKPIIKNKFSILDEDCE